MTEKLYTKIELDKATSEAKDEGRRNASSGCGCLPFILGVIVGSCFIGPCDGIAFGQSNNQDTVNRTSYQNNSILYNDQKADYEERR